MRILHVVQGLNPKLGGLPAAVKGIIAVENQLGFTHAILTISSDYIVEDYPNTEILSFPPSFPKRYNKSKEAIKYLRENIINYDYVVLHSVWVFICFEAANMARKNSVPYLVWPHGSLDPFDLVKKSVLKKILGPLIIRKILESSKAVCCTSKTEAEKLVVFGANPLISVLPLAVVIDTVKGERNRFREKYKYQNDDFVLLFLSRINYKKGLNIIIEGINIISYKIPNIKLFIAGKGDNAYEEQVKKWIVEYDLSDKVILGGQLMGAEKSDAFKGSDLFVLPSMNENFGIAIFESLYYELPVLVSKNVYLWDTIIEEEVGWVCEYSINSFIVELMKAINNRSEYSSKKKNTYYLAEKFSPSILSDIYKRVYFMNRINEMRK